MTSHSQWTTYYFLGRIFQCSSQKHRLFVWQYEYNGGDKSKDEDEDQEDDKDDSEERDDKEPLYVDMLIIPNFLKINFASFFY